MDWGTFSPGLRPGTSVRLGLGDLSAAIRGLTYLKSS